MSGFGKVGMSPCSSMSEGDGGLGLILMSERELQRIEVLSKVLERRMTVVSAAHVLDMTTRQVQRLLKAFRAEGAAALRHKARGRPSNHRYVAGIGELAVQLVREHYLDFGPTLAAEKLEANHGLVVSRETLRKWMAEAGIWLSRKHAMAPLHHQWSRAADGPDLGARRHIIF
ncbi:hypothetical protein MESS4_p40107 [Mesorhizobium sp. STM 4661]|nr:hypothetical protein MESS4_p40107 [Mesorhizobium sp. STM 4661]